jgi:hypothetical protein
MRAVIQRMARVLTRWIDEEQRDVFFDKAALEERLQRLRQRETS